MDLLALFNTPPARKVSTRSNNRMKRAFSSFKTGEWQVMESKVEFLFGVEAEINPFVRRFKTQPERRSYRKADGKRGWTTPDFLVETLDGIEVIECKHTEKKAKYEHRTCQLQQIYSRLGATYRIVTEVDVEVENEDRHFNALDIFSTRMREIPPQLPFHVADAFANKSPRSIGDMEEALGDRLRHRRDLYRLHTAGYLLIDYKTCLLGRDTRITRLRDILE